VNLFNLQPQPYSIIATPLVYNSVSPTPIRVPGGAQNYFGPGARRAKRETFTGTISEPIPTPPPSLPQELLRRGTLTVPTYLATTYPASRLSSACSCLSVPAGVTTTVSRGFFSIDFVSFSIEISLISSLTISKDYDLHVLHPNNSHLISGSLCAESPSQCTVSELALRLRSGSQLPRLLQNGLLCRMLQRLQLRMVEIRVRYDR
jgi:hypothetical protein